MITYKESCIIKYIRIFAMLSIVLCHILQVYDNRWAWVFNVGVQVFLAISGWLYGNKNIINWSKWFKNKILKLYVPYITYVLLVFVLYNLLGNNFPLKKLFYYIFDLQWFLGVVNGLNHLWFMTAIALCYILTPILQFLKKKYPIVSLVVLTIMGITNVLYLRVLNGYFSILFVYCFAYLFSIQCKQIKVMYSVCFSLILLSIILLINWEIILNYSHSLNKLFHLILGILCVIIPIQLVNYLNFNGFLTPPHIIAEHMDKLSYYIYITHHIFMIGPFSIAYLGKSIFLNICLMLLMTLLSAVILKKITEKSLIYLKDSCT